MGSLFFWGWKEVFGEIIPLRFFPSLSAILFTLFVYLSGMFAGGGIIHSFIHGKFGWVYLPFSLLVGMILSSVLYFIVRFRGEKICFFVLCWSLIYILLSSYKIVLPYHIDYLLVFLIPVLFLYRLRKKIFYAILGVSIFFNILQLEMLARDIKRSSFSLSLQTDVIRYMEKNHINKFYNMIGNFEYKIIAKKRIEAVELWSYLYPSYDKERIYLSLLAAKGGIILTENTHPSFYTVGVGPEKLEEVAKEKGFKIEVLKKFPEKGKPVLFLITVTYPLLE